MSLAASPAAASPTFTQNCFADNSSFPITVADFNQDGKLDITINPGTSFGGGFSFSQQIDLYLGNGDGTFTFAREVNAAAAHLDLFAVDVDHDGNLDVAASGNTVTSPFPPASVLRGNGDGTFRSPETYPTTGERLTVGDLNGDGFTDLIASDDKEGVEVLLNQGDGTFGAGTHFKVGNQVRALTTSDINGDGFQDVVTMSVVVGGPGFVVAVLLGKGDGKLGPAKGRKLPGYPGRDLEPADLTGDGKMDLAVAGGAAGGVLVLLGKGDGSFGAPTVYPMAGSRQRIAVGDVDGDGKLDIVAANHDTNFPNVGGNVSILYGDGTGAFTIGTVIQVAYGLGVEVADLDADSDLDIVIDSCVLRNNGPVAAAKATPVLGQPAATADAPKNLTAAFSPNPLRDRGALSFSLPKEGTVSIHLYDLRGRRVQTLMDAIRLPAGSHSVGLDRRAAGLGAGIYFYRIETEGSRKSGSVVFLDH
jgi:hypothetical protein